MFGQRLRETDGVDIEVIDPGKHNPDSGPDFFNSKIRINGTEWVGNVEIHVKASDWYRHGHDSDPAYENVILHVVGISDKRVKRIDGSVIPQAEIHFPENFYKTVAALTEEIDMVRCAPNLHEISPLSITDWLETLAIERLQVKAQRVLDIYHQTEGDWEQATFVVLARALGFGLNSDPFEMLARNLPIRILHHHSDNLFQLQAILFGQAGLLDSSLHIFDEYYQGLCNEYYFLARKYGLRPMRPGMWKFSKTRPQNFPHRRIAYLARLVEGGFSLFSKIIESRKDEEKLKKLFEVELDDYWHSHYTFDTDERFISDRLSTSSINIILINLVAPMIFAYSAKIGDPSLSESAIDILMGLPPENNSIIRQWKILGLNSDNAMRSQALLHLRKEYCDGRKCLYCRFGCYLLRKASL